MNKTLLFGNGVNERLVNASKQLRIAAFERPFVVGIAVWVALLAVGNVVFVRQAAVEVADAFWANKSA